MVCVGCDERPRPDASREAVPAQASAAATPTSLSHGSARKLAIEFADPPGWKRTAPGAMRAVSFEVPPVAGDTEAGDLGVFYFGPDQGGGVEKNVKRWRDSFPDVPDDAVLRSQRKPSGLVQHIVEIADGTYQSGMPGGPKSPKPGYALLGAIVEAPSGHYYFKLTGPKATVAAAKPAFLRLLDSVKPAGG